MEETIEEQNLTVDLPIIVKQKFLEYAEETIVRRALSKHEDGLKPVQRYTLYAMHHDLGLKASGLPKKCAKVVGSVIGNYHAHGDQSAYGALVTLARPWVMRYPLITFQGNCGSQDGDTAAAMRYTECKLSRIGESMLEGIDKNAVDMVPNYDDSELEPKFLPGLFPELLCNGTNGIATGMAAKMAPHYAPDVFKAIKYVLSCWMKQEAANIDEVIRIIKAPDFPTGGILINPEEVRQGYRTGSGRCVLRCKYEIEATKNHDRIVITELPYDVTKTSVIDSIKSLAYEKDDKVIKENVADIVDESGKNGMRLVIVLKRNGNPDLVMNKLYKHTGLQSSFVFSNTTLFNGRPYENLNLLQLIQMYCNKQCQIKLRTTQFDLNEYNIRLEVLQGLIRADSMIDEVIATIRASESNLNVVPDLMEKFDFTERQAKAIDAKKLGSLNKMNVKKLEEERDILTVKAARCMEIINNQVELVKELIHDIDEYVNNGGYFKHDERRTEIQVCDDKIDDILTIPKEDIVVIYSHNQMLKAVKLDEYNMQKRSGKGQNLKLRDNDFVEKVFTLSTHDNILFFTKNGRCYTVPAYTIPIVGKQQVGKYLANYIEIEADDEIESILPVTKEEQDKDLILITRMGLIKRTPFANTVTRFKSARVIDFNEGDSLLTAFMAGDGNVLAMTAQGKGLKFSIQDLRPITSRTGKGVRLMKLSESDYIISALNVDDDSQVFMQTKLGKGKRVEAKNLNPHGRGTAGQRIMSFNKGDELTDATLIKEDESIFLITNAGNIIRIPAASVPIIGLSGKGVATVNLPEGYQVISVSAAPKQEEEEETEEDAE